MPRRLGQHFLKDKRALARIVDALDISPSDTIIEIGPGHGELTRLLLNAGLKKVIAIEKDGNLVTRFLEPLAREHPSLEVVHADAMDVVLKAPELFRLDDYKIAGNIPYYITGFVLRTLGELQRKPARIVITVQKEVAERVTARPPHMNLLAAAVQLWGAPEVVRIISRKLFKPAPKVDSAILAITPHPGERPSRRGASPTQPTPEEARRYYAFIKILFKQPRKTIANNISAGLGIPKGEVEHTLQKLGIEPTIRPQRLDISAINNLVHQFGANAI